MTIVVANKKLQSGKITDSNNEILNNINITDLNLTKEHTHYIKAIQEGKKKSNNLRRLSAGFQEAVDKKKEFFNSIVIKEKIISESILHRKFPKMKITEKIKITKEEIEKNESFNLVLKYMNMTRNLENYMFSIM